MLTLIKINNLFIISRLWLRPELVVVEPEEEVEVVGDEGGPLAPIVHRRVRLRGWRSGGPFQYILTTKNTGFNYICGKSCKIPLVKHCGNDVFLKGLNLS